MDMYCLKLITKWLLFDQRVQKIHIFPRTKKEHFNSVFFIKDVHTWQAESIDDKITSIKFHLNDNQYAHIITIIDYVYSVPPSD